MTASRTITTLAAALACFALARPADAALARIAQDEFLVPADYQGASSPSTGSPVNTRLDGQGGGIGFSGTWSGTGNQFIIDSDTTLSVTGRSSPVGSAATTFASSLTATRSFNTKVQSTLDYVSVVRFSFLITNDNAGGTNGVQLNTDAGGFVRMAQRLNGWILSLSGGALGGTNNLFVTDGSFVAGQTYLVAGQLTIDRRGTAPETASMWVVQDAANAYVGAPLFTSSLNLLNVANPGLPSIGIFKNDTGVYVDSIQLSAVPEPSTFALLGLGVVGFDKLRRRRR